MKLEDVERWRELEWRARERGWTVDLLDKDGMSARKREFALMELRGDERALVTGDLDIIETFLQRQQMMAGELPCSAFSPGKPVVPR